MSVLRANYFIWLLFLNQNTETRNLTLEGDWVANSASWCGKDAPWAVKSNKWSFINEHFKSVIGEDTEKGTYKVDMKKEIGFLDLYPTKGDITTPRKCLFFLKGNSLKIAFSLWFSPGTPQQEIEEGKKMRATRPKSLEPRLDDNVLIITLTKSKQQ